MTISIKNVKPQYKTDIAILRQTANFKYLGFIQNTRNNIKIQLQKRKEKTEAVNQRIPAIAGITTFRNIAMEVIWNHIWLRQMGAK